MRLDYHSRPTIVYSNRGILIHVIQEDPASGRRRQHCEGKGMCSQGLKLGLLHVYYTVCFATPDLCLPPELKI